MGPDAKTISIAIQGVQSVAREMASGVWWYIIDFRMDWKWS